MKYYNRYVICPVNNVTNLIRIYQVNEGEMYWQRKGQETQAKLLLLLHMNEYVTRKILGNK